MAAQAIGFSRSAAYLERKNSPKFLAMWREAEHVFADQLEAIALRRAAMGVNEPIYYRGEKVGDVTKYSDALLMFLLKGRRKHRYRDTTRVVLSDKPKSTIATMTDAELEEAVRTSMEQLRKATT